MYACYIHTVDTYMTAVCINVYMMMFNVYILARFDGFARAATLIDCSYSNNWYIADSSYSDHW